MKENWLLRLRPHPNAAVRLLCFPSAGSGPSMYRTWAESFSDSIDVCGIQLPGREALHGEPLAATLEEIVDQLVYAIEPILDRPFGFFGHSMGAWIAYELARKLHDSGRPLPIRLCVSGNRAPHLPPRHPALHELSDQELIAGVCERFGGIPDSILSEPELMALMLPTIRADMKLVWEYGHQMASTVPCGVSAFGATDDEMVLEWELKAWSQYTEADFRMQLFPGGHFYLNGPSHTQLLAELERDLT